MFDKGQKFYLRWWLLRPLVFLPSAPSGNWKQLKNIWKHLAIENISNLWRGVRVTTLKLVMGLFKLICGGEYLSTKFEIIFLPVWGILKLTDMLNQKIFKLPFHMFQNNISQEKHRKSAKLPWHQNCEHSFVGVRSEWSGCQGCWDWSGWSGSIDNFYLNS